jgi:hypothetical protein
MTVPANLISTIHKIRLAVPADPVYPQVSLLINAEGGLVDATGKNVITAYGNAAVVSGTSKFGTKSIYFDGNTDYLMIADSANFAFGTGDWTVECWALPTAFNSFTRVWSKGPLNTGSSIDMEFDSADVAKPRMPSSSFPTVTGCGFTTGAWHHIAMSKSANTSRFFVDGVLKYTESNINNATNTAPWYIGIHPASLGVGTSFAGYIDEFRVTKGTGRYTANFAVPTATFPTI